MTIDLEHIPYGEVFKTELFAITCKGCGKTFPFYVDNKGRPSFIIPLSSSSMEKFCKDNEITLEKIIENSCFICPCGFPVKFSNIESLPEERTIEEKFDTLKKRASNKNIKIIKPS